MNAESNTWSFELANALRDAVAAHFSGDLQRAEQVYLAVLRLAPDQPIALSNLASVYKTWGKLEQSLSLFRRALALDELNYQCLHNYAGLLCTMGEYESAVEAEEKAICICSDSSAQYTRLAYALWKCGRLEEALVSSDKAIVLDEGNPTAHLNRGAILRECKNLDEALSSTLRAISLQPSYAEALENAGVILHQLGRLKESVTYLSKAIQLSPLNAGACCHMGIVLSKLGHLEEAELLLRRSVELDPSNAISNDNLGVVLNEKNLIDDAILLAQKAIEIDPSYAQAYSNLSTYLRTKGKIREAIEIGKKAISLDPELASAHCTLGCLFQTIGSFEVAEKSFRAAIECQPPSIGAYFYLSSQISRIEADSVLSQLDRVDTHSLIGREAIDLHFAKANLYIKKGDFEQGCAWLGKSNIMKLKRYGSDKEKYIATARQYMDIRDDAVSKPEKSENIVFIVGMPRSGSTLVENILSLNDKTEDLGETTAMPQAVHNWEYASSQGYQEDLIEHYIYALGKNVRDDMIIIDKNLYNYRFACLIGHHLPRSRVIHCFRHPLDNILSMQRAHFANGNRYSSSVRDCADVIISQIEAVAKAKELFPDLIYSQSYEALVNKPEEEIKSLVKWLGWNWNSCYLSPHHNRRAVNTASVLQVRSPINNRSVNGWMNFLELLAPAVPILSEHHLFKGLADEFEEARSRAASEKTQ